jgi:hypothetical protein
MDSFRSKRENSDPEVRLQGVHDLRESLGRFGPETDRGICELLGEILREDASARVRAAAFLALAWWNDPRRMAEAVRQLEEPSVLAEIARVAIPFGTAQMRRDVRAAAITNRHFADIARLHEVALNAREDTLFRVFAVEKLTDQRLLATLARHDEYPAVRVAAVRGIEDQAVLGDLARDEADAWVRKAAVEKLTDQGLLAKFARKDEHISVRVAAVEKLTDRELLMETAGYDVADVLAGRVQFLRALLASSSTPPAAKRLIQDRIAQLTAAPQ